LTNSKRVNCWGNFIRLEGSLETTDERRKERGTVAARIQRFRGKLRSKSREKKQGLPFGRPNLVEKKSSERSN